MNRHDRRRHGAYTRRYSRWVRRSPQGGRMRHPFLSARMVDEHGTPLRPSQGVLSMLRISRNMRRDGAVPAAA